MTEADCDAFAEPSVTASAPASISVDEELQCGAGPVMPLSHRPDAVLVLVESCREAPLEGRAWQTCQLVTVDACSSTNARTTARWPDILDTERTLPWAQPPNVGTVMRVLLNRGMVVAAVEDSTCGI